LEKRINELLGPASVHLMIEDQPWRRYYLLAIFGQVLKVCNL